MHNNNVYNLMMQLTEEHKSLWRIKKEYLKDAKNNPKVKAYWTKNAKEKEAHIKELTVLLKGELK